jgi:hypothetical protein
MKTNDKDGDSGRQWGGGEWDNHDHNDDHNHDHNNHNHDHHNHNNHNNNCYHHSTPNCSQGGNRDESAEGGEDTEGARTLMIAHEQMPSMTMTTTTMKSTTMKRTRTVTAGAVSPLPLHFVWGGFFFPFHF